MVHFQLPTNGTLSSARWQVEEWSESRQKTSAAMMGNPSNGMVSHRILSFCRPGVIWSTGTTCNLSVPQGCFNKAFSGTSSNMQNNEYWNIVVLPNFRQAQMPVLLAFPREILRVRSIAAASARKRQKLRQIDNSIIPVFIIKSWNRGNQFCLVLSAIMMYH